MDYIDKYNKYVYKVNRLKYYSPEVNKQSGGKNVIKNVVWKFVKYIIKRYSKLQKFLHRRKVKKIQSKIKDDIKSTIDGQNTEGFIDIKLDHLLISGIINKFTMEGLEEYLNNKFVKYPKKVYMASYKTEGKDITYLRFYVLPNIDINKRVTKDPIILDNYRAGNFIVADIKKSRESTELFKYQKEREYKLENGYTKTIFPGTVGLYMSYDKITTKVTAFSCGYPYGCIFLEKKYQELQQLINIYPNIDTTYELLVSYYTTINKKQSNDIIESVYENIEEIIKIYQQYHAKYDLGEAISCTYLPTTCVIKPDDIIPSLEIGEESFCSRISIGIWRLAFDLVLKINSNTNDTKINNKIINTLLPFNRNCTPWDFYDEIINNKYWIKDYSNISEKPNVYK